jgi:hypothetical protein
MSGEDKRRGPVPQRPVPGAKKPRSADATWRSLGDPEEERAPSPDVERPDVHRAAPEERSVSEPPLSHQAERAPGPRGLRPAGPRATRPEGLRPVRPEGPRSARPEGARSEGPRRGGAETIRQLVDAPAEGGGPWADVVARVEQRGFTEGRTETVLFDLSVAQRSLRGGEDEPAPVQAPALALAWAGPGMGWEEPAGRALARPAVERVARKEPPPAARTGKVASAGSVAKRGGIASAGVLAGGEADEREEEEVASGFSVGSTAADDERVSSRRQLVLLLAAAALFLVAVGTMGGVYWLARPEPVVEAPPPPDPRVNPTAPEAVDVGSPAMNDVEVASGTGKVVATADPPAKVAEKVEEKKPPAPSDHNDVNEKPDPPRPAQVEEPPKPKAPPASGRLRISFAPGFGGGTLLVTCPGAADKRYPLAAPASPADVIGSGCTPRVRCDGGSQAVVARQLIGKSAATCSGCNSDQPLPVCQ